MTHHGSWHVETQSASDVLQPNAGVWNHVALRPAPYECTSPDCIKYTIKIVVSISPSSSIPEKFVFLWSTTAWRNIVDQSHKSS